MPIGKPKKKRIRVSREDDGSRVCRRIKSVTCSKCGNVVNNGKICKWQVVGRSHARGSGM